MSLTTERPTNVATNLTDTERAFLIAWGDEQGLEVVTPTDASGAAYLAFIGYSDGIPSWSVYRAEGHLWLCDIDYRAGRQVEGSKRVVECIEHATDRIQIDTEA